MIFKDNPPVITGIGLATPIGTSKVSFLENLEKGKSGLSALSPEKLEAFASAKVLGKKSATQNHNQAHSEFRKQATTSTIVEDFATPSKKAFQICEPLQFNDPDQDPFIRYALHAAEEAIADSGVDDWRSHIAAVIVSSSKGGVTTIERILREKKATQQIPVPLFSQIRTDAASFAVMQQFRLRGFSKNVVSACATGLQSICLGAFALKTGDATIALAGASDASITPFMLAAYNRMGVYATTDMFPFDVRREGFIVGEGAGVVVMEKENDARKRKAPIYARLRGFIFSQDLGTMVQHDPDADVLSESILRLLKEAGLSTRDIGHLSLHGTSTLLGDRYEANQCLKAFGPDLNRIFSQAPKSIVGHMLGAAGAVETILTSLSLSNQKIYPTLNTSQLEEGIQFRLSNRVITHEFRYALKISMGFGGHVTVALLEK